MSRIKTHVKTGDHVQVIAGNEKPKTGKILQVIPDKQQVIIEGVRMIKKHARKSQDRPDGGIIELEGPIHISNVKKIDATPKKKAAKKATKKVAKKATKKVAKKATKKATKKAAKPAEEIASDTETTENS